MSKRVLLCLSHSIEEHDQLKLLSGLGYEVASLGGYINPHAPHDPKRPALPEVPHLPEVQAAVDALETDDNLGNAQARVPDAVLDWLGDDGIIIFHHYLERLFGQWDHLAEWRAGGGRVVWRTVGQSVEPNERAAQPFVEDGLEVVRYSPRERNIPGYVGEDALIRFYKDPAEWHGWTGELEVVTNVTQDLRRRGRWCNYDFWREATRDLPVCPMGTGSEELEGGTGEVTLEGMQAGLRDARAYLYTGTQPASYTLGLIEALMTGVPVVSIGPGHMTIFPYGPALFEGHELAAFATDDPAVAGQLLRRLLEGPATAAAISVTQREFATSTFGREVIGEQWRSYLGTP